MRRALVLGWVLMLGTTAAWANEIDDYAKKCTDSDPDISISGCSKLIEAKGRPKTATALAYYLRGNAYARKDEVDHALSDYNQSIEFNPSFARAYFNRAIVHHNKGEHELAKADWKKAFELDPALGAEFLQLKID